MRQLSILCLVIIFLSCSKKNDDNKNVVTSQDDTTTTASVKMHSEDVSITSTYDRKNIDIERHRQIIKDLSDSNVFQIIHNHLILTLSEKHQDYFSSMPDYEIINIASGDLFHNSSDDKVFIVYDKKRIRFSILVYDGRKDSYLELYRDINVRNGLLYMDCKYGAFGTLDYQFADELTYQQEYLRKNPVSHFEFDRCKIVNIFSDDDFVLESGCFALGFSEDKKVNSFCIRTSFTYNNWECLFFEKSRNEFFIFYGQAFAD